MAEEGNNNDEGTLDPNNPGGEGSDSGGSDGGGPGGDNQNTLEDLDVSELVGIIKETRQEAATYRTRAQKAEGKLGDLAKKVERLEELEEKMKTDEEKEEERLAELEAQAAKAERLAPYFERANEALKAELERIEGFDDGDSRKKTYSKLLAGFGEDDVLGKLNAIEALREAEGSKEEVKAGDEGNPGETGGGDTEKDVTGLVKKHFPDVAAFAS